MITIITDRINYRGEGALYLHVSCICAPCAHYVSLHVMLFPNQVEGIDSARTDELVFTVMHALNEPEKGMYSTWYSYP